MSAFRVVTLRSRRGAVVVAVTNATVGLRTDHRRWALLGFRVVT